MLLSGGISFVFVLLIFGIEAQDSGLHNGTYLIVAPKTVRGGLPYSVSVNILKSDSPVTVTIMLTDPQNSVAERSQKVVAVGKPDTIKINKVPSTLSFGVTLHVKGVIASGVQLFDEQTSLQFDPKSSSAFIQTDKAIYKPGSKVHFRLVVVTPDLKPVKGLADIKITDPNRNVIQLYTNQTIDNGVAGKKDSLTFQLIDEPTLGNWIITATIGTQTVSQTFTVDKYVLPKFDVNVKTPPYLTPKDDAVVTVVSKYTYGKGVAGSVTVLAEKSWAWQQGTSVSKTTEASSSGETVFRFTNGELKENKLVDNGQLKFTATVTESLTGIQRNGTGTVNIFPQPYDVKINLPSETFKPGLDFSISIAVTTKDDKPLPEKASRSVKATINYSERWTGSPQTPMPPVEKTLTLDKDGTANFVVNPPINATNMNMHVEYLTGSNDTSSTLSAYRYVEASLSPSNSFLQLVASSTSVHAGSDASFTVKNNDKLDLVTVQVMSRGNMVYSTNVKLSGQTSDFKIPISHEMAPKARVIAYGVRSENKEILVDAMDVQVSGLFTNNVSIDVTPKRAEPNDTVSFKVHASPNSYIGLLAVDQSVLLLKSGNDITAEKVEADIASYSSGGSGGSDFGGPFFRGKRHVCFWCGWWIRGKDAYTIFENSGVNVLTDAFLYHEPPPPMEHVGKPGPAGIGGAESGVLFAASRASASAGEPQNGQSIEPVVRTKFPETWIWTDARCDSKGEAVYTANVPDTITSWITSAFAVHDTDGLAVAPEPTKLEVFRPFFVSLNLPYSVKRGEKLALQALIFNYMKKEQTVTITLDHNANSGFEFIEKPGSTKDKKSKDLNQRLIKVAADGSGTVYFPILPTTVGEVKFLVKAYGQGVSDAVEMPLLVEAEGYPLYRNKPFIVDLSSNSSWSNTVQLDIPTDSVNGSQRAYVSVFGDMLGSALNNIDSLIQMPYGCGEQTMLTLVPNIVIRRYLKATNRLTADIAAKTTRFMESGYQRELTYQRTDSSYSAFGNSEPAGSTWLTAFVVRSFHQAKEYIFIDDSKLKASIAFLNNQQKDNGAFSESGTIHHKDMQGGAGQGGVPLTAYVLIALLENDNKNDKAISYLERNIDRFSNDSYALALISYALHLANSPKKDDAFKLLEAMAVEEADSKHWTKVVVSDEKTPSYWDRPRPVDVEMSSYALQTYLLRNELAKALPIVKWLSSQQNSNGGFSSTQDTVMGISALAAYAEKTYSNKIDVSLNVDNGDQKHTFKVKPDNSIVQQSWEVKHLDKPIKLSASGKGQVFTQVNYHYNLMKLPNVQPFDCSKNVTATASHNIKLGLCCKYNLQGRSNMAVLEVYAPSGYAIDSEELNHLKTRVKDLQRTELERGDSKANIYFNSLGGENVCFDITVDRLYFVAEQKPALLKLYDYYNTALRYEFDYSVPKKLSMEDVCGKQCWAA